MLQGTECYRGQSVTGDRVLQETECYRGQTVTGWARLSTDGLSAAYCLLTYSLLTVSILCPANGKIRKCVRLLSMTSIEL